MTDPPFPARPADPGLLPQTASPPRPDPPSVRAVLAALQLRPRLTAAELREASGLPRRTIYQALRVLRSRGAVEQRRSLQDSRQTYFRLAGEPPQQAGVAGDGHGLQGPAPPRPASAVSVP